MITSKIDWLDPFEAARRLKPLGRLAFLDSDQVMLGEPSRLVLSADHDVGIRPVAMKGVGSGGPDDPNDAYWTRLYDLVGATL